MLDIGGFDGGADLHIAAGKAIRPVTTFYPPGDQQIVGARLVKLRHARLAGLIDRQRRIAFLPGDREIRQIGAGKRVRPTNHQRHRLAAKPRRGLGKRRLIGKGRDHAKGVDAADIRRRHDGGDIGPVLTPCRQITEAEIGKEMRRADGPHQKRILRPGISAECLGGVDLGMAVKTMHGSANRRPGIGGRPVGQTGTSIHDGVDNLGIACTAAQHAADGILDLVAIRRRGVAKQRRRRHHHAGGADAALRRAMPQKCLLQTRQRAVRTGKRFRGFDMPPLDLAGRHQTGTDRAAIQQHCAGTAIAGIASDLGATKPETFTKQIAEPSRWWAAKPRRLTIHREAKLDTCIRYTVHHAASAQSDPMVRQASSAAARRR